ncbi:MAG: hypothetical protein HPKKFMNG_02078 [Planctomycetes bacterium]|nr:hypothetical protein [Planctomycetota bacterium]
MVNRKRNYTLFLFLYAALLVLALGTFNYLGMEYRLRLDLTADRRFTLSEGTRALLDKLPDPVQITYYVSAEPPPSRVNLERDVRDKLEELATASAGKLSYAVVRIPQSEIATKAEDLKKDEISMTQDVQTTGEDEAKAAIGISGYFSSLLVRYGGQKTAINGVINVVTKDDASAQHRVESIEFDVMFAVLKLKSRQTKPPLKQLLRNMKNPLQINFYRSEQMPASYPEVGSNIEKAIERLRELGGQKVSASTQTIPWGSFVRLPFVETSEPTVDPAQAKSPSQPVPGTDGDKDAANESSEKPAGTPPGEGIDPEKQQGGVTPPGEAPPADGTSPPDKPVRRGPRFYYTHIELISGGIMTVMSDFSADRGVDAIVNRLEQDLWTLLQPRAVLGVIAPEGQNPMRAGASSYSEVSQYITGALQYVGREINLKQSKSIPNDVAVLIVFEPHLLSERELYEIDRYLCSGGNVVMLYQGYSADMRIGRMDTGEISLRPSEVKPHFLDWAKRLGISFGSDLLIQPGGYFMQAVSGFGRQSQKQPVSLPLAANVGPEDTDRASVFSRALSGMPLPFPVELNLDETRLSELKLQRQDIIRLSGNIYRFLFEDRNMPRVPRVGLTLESRAEREDDAEKTPGKDVRLQRLGRQPLIAASLSGAFESYWAGKDKLVPRWEGEPADNKDVGGQPVPELKVRPGRLIVTSVAASFNSDYFESWQEKDIRPILSGGIAFYRNVAEASIYGEELISLRAKTGAAPRITGGVTQADRLTWFVICLGGAPALLLLAGFLRGAYRAKAREEYRLKIEGTDNP